MFRCFFVIFKKNMRHILYVFSLLVFNFAHSQTSKDFFNIIDQVSVERIKNDISILANFGTRHTLSDTI